MNWLLMVLNSLIILRSSIADAEKEAYVDKIDVVGGMLVRNDMLDDVKGNAFFFFVFCFWGLPRLLGELQFWVEAFIGRK